MFCDKCGYNNEQTVKFCVKCGNKLEQTVTEIPQLNPSEGAGKCDKCGHINDSGIKFCVKCGNKLSKADFDGVKTRFSEASGVSADNDTYSEFGTGAKIWFGFCGVSNILANIISIIGFITAIINYNSFSIFNTLTIVGAIISISLGLSYFVLMSERKKSTFYFMTIIAAVLLAFNLIVAIFGNLGLQTALVSAISPIINIGITYAVLSKYGGNNLPQISGKFDSLSSKNNTAEIGSDFNGSPGVCCPKCGGKNLQAVSESNTTGGGYGAGKGCCGYILLGPLGLLCGACGSKAKTTTKTFFVCMDCGHKFAK